MEAKMSARMRQHTRVLLALLAFNASACLDRELKPINPCLTSKETHEMRPGGVDKVDLLFVVDNSNSMANKQVSLRMQLPSLIRALTTGERFPGDPNPFPPLQDLHVGVVSSDMGVPGVDIAGAACRADGGDDGRLLTTGRGPGCQARYPSFLSYTIDASSGGPARDRMQFAQDASCITNLGTGGCGFEQQLEAPFKALWPKLQTDVNGNVITPNDYRFIATTESGTWGKGDQSAADGGNLGFLRNDPNKGLSLIAIVLVTDEEDCSVKSTEHLKPNAQLAADSPYRQEDLNLRCYHHKEMLYDIQRRYYEGFRKLRPGREELVVFAAIVGVPVDLVDAQTLAKVDFTADDPSSRNAFYDAILSDPRMQEQIDPASMPGTGTGNLKQSCSRTVPYQTEPVTAYPPRRIVELAKLFGKNGIVQSICQDDFGPAMSAIVNVIATNVDTACMRPLVRHADGTVPCNVIWELPAQPPTDSNAPTRCSERAFLGPVEDGQSTINAQGGNNCKMAQLAVSNPDNLTPPPGAGWYYDDFTNERQKACTFGSPTKQRIAFTLGAKPPSGVKVKLECLNETQHLASTRTDLSENVPQPEIGSTCGALPGSLKPSGDSACIVTLANNAVLDTMFCHAEQHTCVQRCSRDADCPPAWRCDDRPSVIASAGNKGAYCVNPTCGVDGTSP
jgi:hypothetical protein